MSPATTFSILGSSHVCAQPHSSKLHAMSLCMDSAVFICCSCSYTFVFGTCVSCHPYFSIAGSCSSTPIQVHAIAPLCGFGCRTWTFQLLTSPNSACVHLHFDNFMTFSSYITPFAYGMAIMVLDSFTFIPHIFIENNSHF